jgi:hypothetical protein
MSTPNGFHPFFKDESDLGLEGTMVVWFAFVALTAAMLLTGS